MSSQFQTKNPIPAKSPFEHSKSIKEAQIEPNVGSFKRQTFRYRVINEEKPEKQATPEVSSHDTPSPSPLPPPPARSENSCTALAIFIAACALLSSIMSYLTLRDRFCGDGYFGNGCIRCPSDAICMPSDFFCNPGFKKMDGHCVLPESDEELAIISLPIVERRLKTGQYRTVDELLERIPGTPSRKVIELSVNFSREYRVAQGVIQRIFDSSRERRTKAISVAIPMFMWTLFAIYAGRLCFVVRNVKH